MGNSKDPANWKLISEIAKIESPWVNIIIENLEDDNGKLLEYWRAEKPDGLLIVTIQGDKIILPKSMYRPGVKRRTLDFCGGRFSMEIGFEENIVKIVRRELGIKETQPILEWSNINNQPWAIDSSFTNSHTYGVVVKIKPEIVLDPAKIGGMYSSDQKGHSKLLGDLMCVQCRAVALEWLRSLGQ